MAFEVWLTERLNAVGVDGEVFSSYISGSLSSHEGADDAEMEESLLEILHGCLVSGNRWVGKFSSCFLAAGFFFDIRRTRTYACLFARTFRSGGVRTSA